MWLEILIFEMSLLLLSAPQQGEVYLDDFNEEEDKLDYVAYECDPYLGRAIVLKDREFPSVVSIQKDGHHRCSGVIVSIDWVLTAANCVKSFGALDSWTVHVGSNDIWLGQGLDIIDYAIHESYDKANEQHAHSNDIALLKVDPPIQLKDGLEIAKLPKKNQETPVGTNVTLVGWEITARNKKTSRKLKKVYRLIGDPEYCWMSVWSRNYQMANKRQICVRGDLGKVGEYRGNFGWTMHYNGEVIGLATWGDPEVHEYYENIALYIKWIEKRIAWW